ncbi:hypothetical protein FNV62_01445 [Streptomyces sp. RLB3-17]|nr:hypothetical protein FNV62_01445 [Streptomyces sp. RLB3-17]
MSQGTDRAGVAGDCGACVVGGQDGADAGVVRRVEIEDAALDAVEVLAGDAGRAGIGEVAGEAVVVGGDRADVFPAGQEPHDLAGGHAHRADGSFSAQRLVQGRWRAVRARGERPVEDVSAHVDPPVVRHPR